MRSIVLAYNFPPVIGGAEKLLFDLCGALADDGVRVIAGSVDADAERDHDARAGFPITRVRFEPLSFAEKVRVKLRSMTAGLPVAFYEHCARRAIPAVSSIAAQFAPDIVICGWGFVVGAASAMRTPDCLAAAVAHGDDVIEARGIERLTGYWRNLDIIVANSNYTRGLLIDLGVEPDRVVAVPLGIDPRMSEGNMDLPDLTGLGIEGRKVILSLCRLAPHKGTDMLIRALPLIREKIPDAALVIAGDGPYRDRLEKLSDGSGQSEHIRFVGRVTEAEKRGWYASCDLFAMPSRHDENTNLLEGYGYTFLEANAFGKPVVGGRTGGIPDAVNDGVTGLLVDPLDVEEIADAITRILSDCELAERLGRNGIEWVRNERNKDKFLKDAVDVFREAVHKKGKGPA